MQQRNTNIEFLRLVLILMVVLLHFNNDTMGGAFVLVKDRPFDNFALHFFESLSVCAVNCFMIISGYFLYTNTKMNLGKVVDILLIVIFYRIFDYLMQWMFLEEQFSISNVILCFLPANYFAIFYVVCYMLSPFIARIWNVMGDTASNLLITLLISIFIVVPTGLDLTVDLHLFTSTNYLSPITTNGNGAGYTIIQFLVMLSLGMWLRKRQLSPSSGIITIIYLLSSLIMTICIAKCPSLYNYCSIFTVITAVCLFLLFCKLEFQNKIINYCAKSCFAIFCIHTGGFANYLWHKIITEGYFTNGIFQTILWMFVSVSCMFLGCMALSIVMRVSFGKFKSYLASRFPVYTIN